MNTFADRLKYAMTLRQMTQSDLSRAVGITPAAVKKWIEGKVVSPKATDCYVLSQALGVNWVWLVAGKGGIEGDRSLSNDEFVALEKLDLKASCGTGNQIALPDAGVELLSVGRSWFESQFPRFMPGNIRIVTAEGDSMSPMIEDGDLVFLDVREASCDRDGVYFLMMDDLFFIKRVQRTFGGRLILISENPKYRDIEIAPDSQVTFKVFGRVIKSFKSLDYK